MTGHRKHLQKAFYILAVAVFLVWTLGPIAWSFSISITPQKDTMISPAPFLPENPTTGNYSQLIFGSSKEGGNVAEGRMFKIGLINSLKACLLVILVGIPVSVFAAYALARLRFRGKEVVRYLLLATMAFPLFSTIVPLYKIFSDFKLIDNYWSLILVYISSFLPLTVWLLSNHFESIPSELDEAAAIDSCNSLQTLIYIHLPISYPVIFAGALIMFISTWNQYLIPLIIAPSLSTKPIAVIISEFVTKTSINYGLMNAGGLLAIIPPVIIALVFRRFLIYGLTSGATKG